MKPALAPSDHTITISTATTAESSTPTTHTYHLRSLRTTSNVERHEIHTDIVKWTQFCASVFSYKPNPPPPSYFARHYHNDPRHDPALVRVLIHCPDNSEEERINGEIVSSVRIFRRTLSTGSSSSSSSAMMIEAGGIGEVCTSPNHQRRGLSKLLLKDALNIMSTSCKEGGEDDDEDEMMSCSLLHASPDFRPVYSKVGGYQSVRSEWSAMSVNTELSNARRNDESDGNNKWCIRHANFPKDALSLQKLHVEYSEKRLITIARSVQYWEEYVSAELRDTLWILTKPYDDDGENDDKIAAWISVRPQGDRYQMREFGVDKSINCSVSTCWALERLLGVALGNVGGNSCAESEVSLLLPTFVVSEMKREMENTDKDGATFFDIDGATEENDDGWMYVNFDESQLNVLELTTREIDTVPHLIWPTDSF